MSNGRKSAFVTWSVFFIILTETVETWEECSAVAKSVLSYTKPRQQVREIEAYTYSM